MEALLTRLSSPATQEVRNRHTHTSTRHKTQPAFVRNISLLTSCCVGSSAGESYFPPQQEEPLVEDMLLCGKKPAFYLMLNMAGYLSRAKIDLAILGICRNPKRLLKATDWARQHNSLLAVAIFCFGFLHRMFTARLCQPQTHR